MAVHCLESGCIGLYIPSDLEISLGPRDVPRASPSGHLSGLGKSLGRRGCTTQYIPPFGSVRIQYHLTLVSPVHRSRECVSISCSVLCSAPSQDNIVRFPKTHFGCVKTLGRLSSHAGKLIMCNAGLMMVPVFENSRSLVPSIACWDQTYFHTLLQNMNQLILHSGRFIINTLN